MVQIVMLDDRIINMIQEVRNHPKLFARMEQAKLEGANAHATIFTMSKEDDIPLINTFEEGIAFLAAEAGILIHGDYSYEAICDLCDKIREALIEKRSVWIGDSPARNEAKAIITNSYKH